MQHVSVFVHLHARKQNKTKDGMVHICLILSNFLANKSICVYMRRSTCVIVTTTLLCQLLRIRVSSLYSCQRRDHI